jgi:hypothetical protein
LEERRQRLEFSIRNFHAKLDTMLEGFENEDLTLRPVEEEDPGPSGNADEDPNGWQTMAPEHMTIFMPSSLEHADIQRLGLVTMASQELELRQGQANDALEGLRLALGHKALLYRRKVRDVLEEG